MATKNNRRTQITRMLLKTGLTELMHKKAINQITIKEICEQADLNRSTFYLHYTDQFALLEDIEKDIITTTFDHLQNVGDDVDTLTYIETFLDYVKNNSDIFEILLCQQETEDFKEKFINKVLEQLKGQISINCTARLEKYVYSFLLHGCIHIIIDWITSGFDISSREVSELIFRLCDSCHSI